MSRTSRRAAARRKMHFLLGATVVGVLLILVVLATQLFGGAENPPDGTISGNSDTNTVIITSTNSNSDFSMIGNETDSNTDTTTDTSTKPSTSTDTNTSDTDSDTMDFSSLQMILVNPDHPIPDDFPLKLSWVSLNGKDRQVHSICAQAFKDMVNAAKEDGVILWLRSTYRGIDLQTEGFNNKVKEYINKGYSKEDATKIAATIVAVPGTSEHHTGLAADITTPSFDRLNKDFDKTEAYQWLITHCAEYGFILRYPADKTEITKIIYEPWHYRYVGVEAAKIIMSEGICYEEFLEKYGNQ